MNDTLIQAGNHKGRRFQYKPIIKVLGVGAAGSNIINSLYGKELPAELISINTDWKQLSAQRADRKLLVGLDECHGHGCGGDVVKGKHAVEGSLHHIRPLIKDTEMVFIVGGLGNGTASGGLAVIAEEAKKRGAVVIGFLIIPFFFRKSDIEKCEDTLSIVKDYFDTCIVLDQNRLGKLYKDLPFTNSFVVMNDLIAESISSLLSLIREPELLEVNFSDIKNAFTKKGFGTIGIAQLKKNDDLTKLVEHAMSHQLFHFDPKNADHALVHVKGDSSLSLKNVNEITSMINYYTSEDAETVVSAKVDDAMKDMVKAVVITTGIDPKGLSLQKELQDLQALAKP